MGEMIEVHESDLHKILDVLNVAVRHHVSRDEMNASLHMAPTTRYAPLTSGLAAAADRVNALLGEAARS